VVELSISHTVYAPLVFFVMKETTVRPGVMCKQTVTILFWGTNTSGASGPFSYEDAFTSWLTYLHTWCVIVSEGVPRRQPHRRQA